MPKKETSGLVTASVIGIASAAALYLLIRKRRGRQDVREEHDGTFIRLTELEERLVSLGTLPISTLTWFEGDYQQAACILKERVEGILRANPWLGGRLMKRQGNYYIFYTSKSTSPVTLLEKRFQCATPEESPLNRGMPLADLAKTCQTTCADMSLLLKQGQDFYQPFWKVSVVPCSKSPSTHFAVMVSMSHIIADGHTFYSLHNMLMGGDPIRELEASRISTTQQCQEEAMGKVESGVMWSVGLIISAVRGVFMAKVMAPFSGGRFQVQHRCFLVDPEKIKKLKAESKGVPFVSTNDVITSWFLRNCACQHGFMAVNFRNKLEGHTDLHAGNYENCLYYRNPDDTSSPSLIRLSVQTLKRAVTWQKPYSNRDMATSHFGLITNWASFASNTVNLQGAKECVHLPLMDSSSQIPATLATGLIFRSGPNQLAVMVAGTPEKMVGLSNAPFESDQLLY